MIPVFSLSPKRIAQILLLVTLCLTLLSVAAEVCNSFLGYDIWLFNVDKEGNVPSWYGSSTLLLTSGILAIVAAIKKTDGDAFVWHWRGLSLTFLALSLDEAASIHEKADTALRSVLGTGGFLRFVWVVPAVILVLIFGLVYLRFVVALPGKTRWLFLLAGILFVGGAVGVEMIGGWYVDSHLVNLYGTHDLVYALITSAEELLEMTGIVVFIYALTSYMSTSIGEVRIRIGTGKPRSEYRQ